MVEDVSATEISAMVADLDRNGVAYEDLAWRQPDLEDVYLTVTGQAVGGGGDPVEESTGRVETGVVQ